jgi:hypothetical protein
MTRRKWTITTWVTGARRDVDLVLYDNLTIMRRESTRFAKHIGEKAPDFHEAQGVCHGFERIHISKDSTETSDPLSAIIRLSRGSITPLIVSHEVAHAAQHIYLLDVLGYDSKQLATNHFTAGNEEFAHLYGELFSAAWTSVEAGRNA